MQYPLSFKPERKALEAKVLYWGGYLLLFTLIEGMTEFDFLQVFRNELISLPLKIIFVSVVIKFLFAGLIDRQQCLSAISLYIVLVLVFALLLRLVDNEIILRYFLIKWQKEPLLSSSPFLYNMIKLQFLLAIPLFFKLYTHFTTALKIPAPQSLAQENETLLIRCERRMVNLPHDDIIYCEAQGNYMKVATIKGTFKTYLSMSELEKRLPGSGFCRIHRSFIVAVNKVEEFNQSEVTAAGHIIPIGRSYQSKTKHYFKNPNTVHPIV